MGNVCLKEVLSRICGLFVRGCGEERACVSPEEDSKEIELDSPSSECMDVAIWGGVDDLVLEKILARLPFESLFRAPSLSKSWRQRFKFESFQHEVCSSSTAEWNSYAPVLVNRRHTQMLGYHRSSERWYRLPTLECIPRNAQLGPPKMLMAGCGSLLCWTYSTLDGRNLDFHILVTNSLTKTRKELRSGGRVNKCTPPFMNLLWDEGNKTYKVILGYVYYGFQFPHNLVADIHIFDSSDSSWTTDSYSTELNSRSDIPVPCGSAIMNGVFYMLILSAENDEPEEPLLFAVISFDLKEKIWKGICHVHPNSHPGAPFCRPFYDMTFSRLLVRGADVMLVCLVIFDDFARTLSVHRLDLGLGLTVEVSRAPHKWIGEEEKPFEDAVWHGDWIYVGRYIYSNIDRNRKSVLYNVRTNKWHRFHSAAEIFNSALSSGADLLVDDWVEEWSWTSVTYQPGLNPFHPV